MENQGANIFDILLGALLIALGLLFLASQQNLMNKMIDIARETKLENPNLYQQYSAESIESITDEELTAVIMGYREYQIMIDSTFIGITDTDYTKYLSLLKDGSYAKSYSYDASNHIIQVNYKYTGTNVS